MPASCVQNLTFIPSSRYRGDVTIQVCDCSNWLGWVCCAVTTLPRRPPRSMNRAAPRQRSPQPSDGNHHQTLSTNTATTNSSPSSSHSRTFTPTPPFITTSANPYSKPGYFLTPQSSLGQLHLTPSMWLWKGTRSHYIVDAAGASVGASRKQQWGVDSSDFDVHAALRPLIALQPTITTLSPLAVPTFYQRTNATLLAALSSHPQLLSHLQDTDHPTLVEREAEKGLVILLHGCTHDGSDWFTLPEERRIVRLLLASGYSAVALTSVDRDSGCWDNRWSADNVDVQRVIAALQAFIAAHYNDGKHPPLFVMGASSGGTFASILSRTIPTTAQCIIVSPGSDKALLTPTTHQTSRPYTEWSSAVLSTADRLYSVPPTAWLYMLKDTEWASQLKIASTLDAIQHKASSLGHRISKSTQATLLLPVKQHPLTKPYMAQQLDGWQVAAGRLSELFYVLAHREGFVDRYDYLIDNPRQSGMAQYMVDMMVRELDGEGGELVNAVRSEVAGVGEELAVLWGQHEMTSEHMAEVVLWMERQRTRAAR